MVRFSKEIDREMANSPKKPKFSLFPAAHPLFGLFLYDTLYFLKDKITPSFMPVATSALSWPLPPAALVRHCQGTAKGPPPPCQPYRQPR